MNDDSAKNSSSTNTDQLRQTENPRPQEPQAVNEQRKSNQDSRTLVDHTKPDPTGW